ncbi:proteasome assembly chaperone 1-like [Saccoglossus kowalevskii]|uniref:Proteasome assembly chaperone 1 n=1 Tax=Saccoglossus kowalevskii TaxID=10224 RepID=A0ABM0GN68_SACKO|nr:PREDICTED: proteasome assembly chaperone 1-like [Saccoglossus kowalevskii]
MATFFGEIVTFPSRAVDEEEDDDDVDQVTAICQPVLRWCPEIRLEISKSPDKTISCKTLIVAVGPVATGFIESYVLSKDDDTLGVVVSGMKQTDGNSFSQTMHTDKSCFIYRLRQHRDIVVCQCNSKVSAEQAFIWTQQVFSNIKQSSQVIILSSLQVTEYKSHSRNHTTPFLNCLCSSTLKTKPVCPYLSQPNTVADLPAAILNYCQVYGIAAVLYVTYSDTAYLEVASMKSFLPLLDVQPLKDIVKINSNIDFTLKKLVELNTSQNPLYL